MLRAEELIFVDETGTNLSMTRTYGRAEKGERANSIKPVSRGKLLTLIGAVSLEGMIASMRVEGGTKKETFITYIAEVLVPELKLVVIVVIQLLNWKML